MADSLCINHTSRPASNRCFTCHKPICDECAVKTSNGTFCSEDCQSKYLKFNATYQASSKGGLFAKLKQWIAYLLFLAAAAAVIIFVGAKVMDMKLFKNILKGLGL